MKNTKKIIALGLMALTILIVPMVASANSANNPAEILSKVTGQSVEDINRERANTFCTYGEFAADYEKANEFHEEMFKQREEVIKKWLAEGKLTQEEADFYMTRGGGCHGGGRGMGRGMGHHNRMNYDNVNYSNTNVRNMGMRY